MAKSAALFALFVSLHPILCVYSLSPNDEPCQSIIEVASAPSTEYVCEPLGDCTGLSCFSNLLNQTVVLTVDKCTDPLEVNVTVYDAYNSMVLSDIVTGTGQVSSGDHTAFVSVFERDKFSVTVMVVSLLNGSVITTIPTVEIPLNASDCMCESIKHIGENIESPVQTSCMFNSGCTGQECTFRVVIVDYLLESEVISCAKPPGFTFIVRDPQKEVVSEDYFDSDRNTTLLSIYPFHVTVEHRKYSIIVSGKLLANNQVYNLIPKEQIILDLSKCVVPPSSSSMVTAYESPKPITVVVSPETCKAIKDAKDDTNARNKFFVSCSVNPECDTMTCVTFNEYSSSFQIKPCLDPPSVHVVVADGGVKVYDDVVSETTTIIIPNKPFTMTVGITQEDGGLGIQVDGNLGFQPFPITRRTTIPIDTCYCPGVHCSSLLLMQSRDMNIHHSSPLLMHSSERSSMATETVPPTSSRGRSSSASTIVAVVIPTTLLFVIAVLGLIIIIVVVLVLLVKRRRVGHSGSKADSVLFKEIIHADENESEILTEEKDSGN